MKLYLAGPMTGIKDLNFPLFHAEAERLRAAGHEVINPAEVNPDHGMPWAECMRRDIPELVKCWGVATLPGCENSRGATLEIHIAQALGMPCRPVAAFLSPEGGIEEAARALVAAASEAGVVLTIEQRALPRLAMGHYETVVSTRPARVLA